MRARVLWVLVTLMLGAGGLVATEVVQERLSDRQMRQRLNYSLSQIRAARGAIDAAEAHVRGTYDAMHARIVADSLADLEPVPEPPPPPPADTTVEEPPPLMVELSPALTEESGGVRATWRAVPGVTEYGIRGEAGGQVVTYTVADTTVWSPGVPETARFCVTALGATECVDWVREAGPEPEPDPGDPGDPGDGGAPYSHMPTGWRTLTDFSWGALTGGGWSYNQRDSFARIVQDPTAHGGTALEYVYPAGFASGRDPAAVHHYGVRGQRRFYLAFTARFSSPWTHQDPGMKFAHLMGAGWNMHLDAHHPNPAWGERYGSVAGEWAWAPTGWSGIGAPAVFNNVNRTAARVTTEWQTVEVLVDMEARVLRQWVNGILTADHRNVPFPSGSVDNFHFAGTWGGGNISRVPQDQWTRLGRAVIAVP